MNACTERSFDSTDQTFLKQDQLKLEITVLTDWYIVMLLSSITNAHSRYQTVWTRTIRLPKSQCHPNKTKLSIGPQPNQINSVLMVKLESIWGHPSTNRISSSARSPNRFPHNLIRTNIHMTIHAPSADHQRRQNWDWACSIDIFVLIKLQVFISDTNLNKVVSVEKVLINRFNEETI